MAVCSMSSQNDCSYFETMPFRLHSRLRHEIENSQQAVATGRQWLGVIRNSVGKGVVPVEIQASGIMDLLTDRPGDKVHREELLDHLDVSSPSDLLLQREVSNTLRPGVHFVLAALPLPPFVPKRIHGRRVIRLLHYREPFFGVRVWLNIDYDEGLFGRFRYWTITVPRLRGFPVYDATRTFARLANAMVAGREWIERVTQHFARLGLSGGWCSRTRFDRYALPGGEGYTEWLITAPHFAGTFVGEHFDIENVVAHVRTTERRDLAGRRILLLEEIQSDWNQTLRYLELGGEFEVSTDELPDNPYRHHWLDIALRYMLLLAANRHVEGVAWLPGSYHVERFPWASASGLAGFYDDLVPRAVARIGKAWGISLVDAQVPFPGRTTTIRKDKVSNRFEVVLNSDGTRLGPSFLNRDAALEHQRVTAPLSNERLPLLMISESMRRDLLLKGLPTMGAIGNRRTTDAGSFGEPASKALPA